MATHTFDESGIRWSKLGDFEHLLYCILDINEELKIIDVLFKFSANQQIVLHRHKVHNNTFVVQGEHRLYEADGRLKEIRPTGSYTVSPPSEEPHREGGGEQDVIVLFSIRGSDGVLYEILDDDQNTIATLTMQDLVGLFELQKAA
ncbi:hypothetical protein MCAMS1_00385 [biofilm metagenome]